jgi:Ca-activated chloride channel family protein
MFEFHWPWAALLLPVPFLIPFLWPEKREGQEHQIEGERITLLHPHLEELQAAYQARRPRRRLTGWLYRILLYLLWAALVVALMRPQWLTPHTEVSTPGYDLMMAIDTSHSMEALDFSAEGRQVSRMAVIKGVMGRFMDARKGDRVGLIIFGSQAFVLSPLSIDRAAAHQLLDAVVPGIAGEGTAMGDAIALGAKRLRERPKGSRVMILITDGDNTNGSFAPFEAAALARAWGIRIYTIGVGSKEESIPILEDGVIKYRDDLGMDDSVLKRVADITGGAYFRATDTRALEEISARINQLEKTEAQARTVFLPHPLFRIPLSLAVLALLGLGLFPEGRRRFAKGLASA